MTVKGAGGADAAPQMARCPRSRFRSGRLQAPQVVGARLARPKIGTPGMKEPAMMIFDILIFSSPCCAGP
jgi:hypothetical protein